MKEEKDINKTVSPLQKKLDEMHPIDRVKIMLHAMLTTVQVERGKRKEEQNGKRT